MYLKIWLYKGWKNSEFQCYSCRNAWIPVPFQWNPVESGRIQAFLRESEGHQKVLYLSQILMELLNFLISLQRIKISIYVCNVCEVIISSFGTINFTTKDQSQLVWTSFFFCIVDRLGLVFKGLVAVPQYLNWSRPVAVASCFILK